MSTSRLPKPSQRQADYANIGYAGRYEALHGVLFLRLISCRKTGVVLKDTGDRDEYGMPNIDDLFSPPPEAAPSSKKTSLLNGTSKVIAHDGLDDGLGMYF